MKIKIFWAAAWFVCIRTWHPGIQYHNPMKHLQSYSVRAFRPCIAPTRSLSLPLLLQPLLYSCHSENNFSFLFGNPPNIPLPLPCHSSQCFTPSSWLHLQLHYPTPNPFPPASCFLLISLFSFFSLNTHTHTHSQGTCKFLPFSR